MSLPLRWKILLFTVLPLVTLTFATLWMVNRSVSAQALTSIRDDLQRASAVFENILDQRSRALATDGEVIVQDPRFFSVLMLPGSQRDRQLRATVNGVAHDFNAITHTDLFEVFDARGGELASVGRDASTMAGRHALLDAALAGRPATGILVGPDAHYQVTVTPVAVGGASWSSTSKLNLSSSTVAARPSTPVGECGCAAAYRTKGDGWLRWPRSLSRRSTWSGHSSPKCIPRPSSPTISIRSC
jgi:hypothetical protein